MRLLVVEDDRKVAGFIQMGLREEGFAVDIARDGQEATSLVHITDYDAIILDMMLPKKNGLQVAAEMRREGRKTPICIPMMILAVIGRAEFENPDITRRAVSACPFVRRGEIVDRPVLGDVSECFRVAKCVVGIVA